MPAEIVLAVARMASEERVRSLLSRERTIDTDRDNQETWDLVVVGLGPVGATAACLAAAHGPRTLVIERDRRVFPLPRAVHLDFEVMRILDTIGVADAFAPKTRALAGMVHLGADGRPIRQIAAPDLREAQGWPASNLFYQPELEAALRDAALQAGVTLRAGHELRDLAPGEPCRLNVRETATDRRYALKADYVIACDGARSTVRRALGVTLTDLGFDEPWLVVDALVEGPMRWPARCQVPATARGHDHSIMVCDPLRPTTVIPGPGRHRRWEFMVLPQDPPDLDAPDQVSRLMSEWIGEADVEILRAALYRFHGLVADTWRDGRIFLAGDAAHQTPPFYGQGLCHGMRDVANLIWKIAAVRSGAPEDLLDTYGQERCDHVTTVIRAAIASGAAVCLLDPVQAAERDAALRAAQAAGAGMRVLPELIPALADGLVRRGEGDAGLAGSRFPNWRIAGADGIRRHDDRAGLGWSLIGREDDLRFALSAADRDGLAGIGFTLLHLAHAASDDAFVCLPLLDDLEARGAAFVIVRPDRYVFTSARDAVELRSALESLFAALSPGVSEVPAPAGDRAQSA